MADEYDPTVDEPSTDVAEPDQTQQSEQWPGEPEARPQRNLGRRELVQEGIAATGASRVGQAAFMGDIEQESSFNPRLVDDHGTSYGLFQTGRPMFGNYRRVVNPRDEAEDLYLQPQYILEQYKRRHPERWAAINNAPNAAEALHIYRTTPGWGYGIAGKRYQHAMRYQQELGVPELNVQDLSGGRSAPQEDWPGEPETPVTEQPEAAATEQPPATNLPPDEVFLQGVLQRHRKEAAARGMYPRVEALPPELGKPTTPPEQEWPAAPTAADVYGQFGTPDTPEQVQAEQARQDIRGGAEPEPGWENTVPPETVDVLKDVWKHGVGQSARALVTANPATGLPLLAPYGYGVREIAEGVREGAGMLAEGFVGEPDNLALIAASEGLGLIPVGAGLAGRAVSLYFAYDMSKQLPEFWQQFKDAPDLQSKTAVATHAIGTLVMMKQAASHGLKPGARAELGAEVETRRAAKEFKKGFEEGQKEEPGLTRPQAAATAQAEQYHFDSEDHKAAWIDHTAANLEIEALSERRRRGEVGIDESREEMAGLRAKRDEAFDRGGSKPGVPKDNPLSALPAFRNDWIGAGDRYDATGATWHEDPSTTGDYGRRKVVLADGRTVYVNEKQLHPTQVDELNKNTSEAKPSEEVTGTPEMARVAPQPPTPQEDLGRLPEPVVPATAPEAERNVTMLEEIRKAGADTTRKVQKLFPKAKLSREQAAELRRQAWGQEKPKKPEPIPEAPIVPARPRPPLIRARPRKPPQEPPTAPGPPDIQPPPVGPVAPAAPAAETPVEIVNRRMAEMAQRPGLRKHPRTGNPQPFKVGDRVAGIGALGPDYGGYSGTGEVTRIRASKGTIMGGIWDMDVREDASGQIIRSQSPHWIPEDAVPAEASKAAGPTHFQTSSGSMYQVHDDGTTTRNKAPRKGESDHGPKEKSEKTVYVSPEHIRRLAMPVTGWRLIDHGDGSFSLGTMSPNGFGIPPSSRNIRVEAEPATGLHPLELWDKQLVQGKDAYAKAHIGNVITELHGGAPKAEAPPAGGVSIPVMITKKMEADLKARGYTQEEINKMKPQEAHDILATAAPTLPAETKAAVTKLQEAAKPGQPPKVGDRFTHEGVERVVEKVTKISPRKWALKLEGVKKLVKWPATKVREMKVRAAFDNFGEGPETPVAYEVMDAGGLLSMSGAKAKGVYEDNKELWDDKPDLKHPTHRKIYSPNGLMPDIMAQRLYDRHLIKEASVDAMNRALEQESRSARSEATEKKRIVGEVAKADKQDTEFIAAQQRQPGEPIPARDLQVGDKVTVEDQEFAVKDIDPDTHDVTLEDGSRFGVQTVKDNEVIYGELEPVERAGAPEEFAPETKPEPEKPKPEPEPRYVDTPATKVKKGDFVLSPDMPGLGAKDVWKVHRVKNDAGKMQLQIEFANGTWSDPFDPKTRLKKLAEAELVPEKEMPFNLTQEAEKGGLTEEGQARATAEAEAQARKEQPDFFAEDVEPEQHGFGGSGRRSNKQGFQPGPANTPAQQNATMVERLVGHPLNPIGMVKSLLSGLAPSIRGPKFLEAANELGRHLGKMHRRGEITSHELNPHEKVFTKLGVDREGVPPEQNVGNQFASDISMGRPVDPRFQKAWETFEKLRKSKLAALHQAEAPLRTLREHYFPGMWDFRSRRAFNAAVEEAIAQGVIDKNANLNLVTDVQAAWIKERADRHYDRGTGSDNDMLGFLSKRPMRGRESFRKEKIFDDYLQAQRLGLRPISYNPITIMKLKFAEMDRSIMAHEYFQALERKGLLQVISPWGQIPEGWRKVPDPYSQIIGPPTVTIKEWLDQAVYDGLESALANIGGSHVRKIGIGGKRLGYAETGRGMRFTEGKVVTRFGTETSVLAHELGHQLDAKFGLWDTLVTGAQGVGAKGEVTKAASRAARVQINNELRAIADLTGRGKYARKKVEKMAQVLEAYIHAPDMMKTVAPTVFSKFDEFVKNTAPIAHLADLRPGLVLKQLEAQKYVGMPIMGIRVIPAEHAVIMDNYLSKSIYNSEYFGKPYKGWMGTANTINQSQLGLGSAFHFTFTLADAVTSNFANVLKDGYGVMTGNRSVGQLAATTGRALATIVRTPIMGDRVLNAWRNSEPSMDARIIQVVKAGELAGGRFEMERGLVTEQWGKMVRNWYSGHKIRAAFRSPIAVTEALAYPIMRFWVPRLKAGVFADMAWRVIEQNPGKTLEELTPQFRQVWNRVDSRLGQVVYDRVFMRNVAKNFLQGVIRAPGWSGGTIVEIGGAFPDAAKFMGDWVKTGHPPRELPDRVAYTMTLLMGSIITNALLTYAFTGQRPRGLDFWAFRDGGTDEYGNPTRMMLPTYMKDILSYVQHPATTIGHKLHPLLSVANDVLLQNKDYYGTEIRHPDDPLYKQAGQVGTYLLKAFEPFWWRGLQQQMKKAGGVTKAVVPPYFGIMPAPRSLTETPAEHEASQRVRAHLPQGARTQEQAEHAQNVREVIRDIQLKRTTLQQALRSRRIEPRDLKNVQFASHAPALTRAIAHLGPEDVYAVWTKANPEERRQIRQLLLTKIQRSKTLTLQRQREMLHLMNQ